ncbi:nucleotide disphospho-sugar-binding domain-containing protein [Gloeocapsa sp. PCC 73106]|uniref:nucleotide disphospho-sugar-binding domain-containing protein n=1 Tax=Gloeocapsa sp. PCC 73106 TaxID=102232 RepID=UPI0002AC4F36|nr:nucleotide disphospho-sugar-binding domain-containing protein [Gloeocapsa sp. PCC 73106]ELR98530.1 glycosyl transferase, UDP-glucuronosyltransferase [Gloeocapsa sp. PCC 73106]
MRILALPNSFSIAHVTRLLEIAKILRARGHNIIFAGNGRGLDLVVAEEFEVRDLVDRDPNNIVSATRSKNFFLLFGDPQEIKHYTEAELAMYRELKPDLVLSDDRITASTSTSVANLPHAAVCNAHFTVYSQLPFYIPFYSPSGFQLPQILKQPIYDSELWIEKVFFDLMLKGVHQTRREYKLNKIFAYQYNEGKDLTLLADVPSFTPLNNLPKNFHYVGPITWSCPFPAPSSLEVWKQGKKRVYLTLGSGGFGELVCNCQHFADTDMTVIVTVGNLIDQVSKVSIPKNVFIEKYINASTILPHCDVIVCHGGNGTIYQALQYSVPIIGISSHAEQDYGARRIEQLGLGLRLVPKEVMKDFSVVIKAIDKVINTPKFKENAELFSLQLKNWEGAKNAADLLEKYFS